MHTWLSNSHLSIQKLLAVMWDMTFQFSSPKTCHRIVSDCLFEACLFTMLYLIPSRVSFMMFSHSFVHSFIGVSSSCFDSFSFYHSILFLSCRFSCTIWLPCLFTYSWAACKSIILVIHFEELWTMPFCTWRDRAISQMLFLGRF